EDVVDLRFVAQVESVDPVVRGEELDLEAWVLDRPLEPEVRTDPIPVDDRAGKPRPGYEFDPCLADGHGHRRLAGRVDRRSIRVEQLARTRPALEMRFQRDADAGVRGIAICVRLPAAWAEPERAHHRLERVVGGHGRNLATRMGAWTARTQPRSSTRSAPRSSATTRPWPGRSAFGASRTPTTRP